MPDHLTPSPACYPFKMNYFICNGDIEASQRNSCTQCHDHTLITS